MNPEWFKKSGKHFFFFFLFLLEKQKLGLLRVSAGVSVSGLRGMTFDLPRDPNWQC